MKIMGSMETYTGEEGELGICALPNFGEKLKKDIYQILI
jgi:hypothetical protein